VAAAAEVIDWSRKVEIKIKGEEIKAHDKIGRNEEEDLTRVWG
jgi:hypothetical protein